MTILKQGSLKASSLGFKRGESARQWVNRDPVAAKTFGNWIKANHAQLVKAVADKVCAF